MLFEEIGDTRPDSQSAPTSSLLAPPTPDQESTAAYSELPSASSLESRPESDHDRKNPSKGIAFFAPLHIDNFRRLIAGQTISRLGDQFYFIAIPWLILRT